MGANENRKKLLGFYEAFNRRELDSVMDDMAPDFVDHEVPEELGIGQGRDAAIAWLEMNVEAFPDLRFEAIEVIAEGDLVAARARFTGTHRGELMGIPATGRRVDLEVGDFVRFDGDGRAVEHWGYTDNLRMMQQLGVVPEDI